MIFLYQSFSLAMMCVGVFMAAREVQARTRVIMVATATAALVVYLLTNEPIVRLYDLWFIFLYGVGCLIYWYKVNFF